MVREPGPGLQSCSGSQVPGPGKDGRAGTTCLKAGGLCPHPCPPATPQLCGTSTRGREMAGRACCLLGLWEGSQWFAKNSPKSWLCLPAGSRAPPWSGAKGLADGPFMFPVTGTQSGDGPGSRRLGWEGGREGVALPLSPGLRLEPEERRLLFHSERVLTPAPTEHLAASPVGLEPHQVSALSFTSCVPPGDSRSLSVPDSLV